MGTVNCLQNRGKTKGQVRGIKKMLEDGRYCVDMLIQLRSVISAPRKVQENVFQHHLETCVHDSLHNDNEADRSSRVEEILKLISQFRNH